MTGRLLILFAICALAAAMIPRDRRAVPSEEQSTSTDTTTRICASETPCAWTVYKTYKESIEYNLTNTYCTCSSDTVCRVYVDDTAISASVHRCLPLQTEDENSENMES